MSCLRKTSARTLLAALEHLEHERTTVAAKQFCARGPADLRELERRLCERRLHRSVAIPHDDHSPRCRHPHLRARRARPDHAHGDQAALDRGRRTARMMRELLRAPDAILTDLGHDLADETVRKVVRLRLTEGGKA
jgi:hypothetical protein